MSLKQIGGNYNFNKISGVWDLEDQIYVNKTIGQIEKYTFAKSSSKFWPAVETTEQSFIFNYGGTKALLCGLGDYIYQFRASVPFDPSSLTPDIDTFSLPNNPTAVTFGNSGNFLYTSNSTTIYQYTCVNGPYDITNLSLTNTLTAQANTTGAALVFKSDGSRLFTINGTDGIVHSYAVGNGVTNQWNLSASIYDSVKKYTHFNNLSSLTFSSDGTKMYLGDNNTNDKGIIKYNLSVAWDVTTASNAVDVYDLSISSATNSTGTIYGDSGNKLYVMRDDGQVTQLNLGTAYRGNNVTSFTNKTTQADSKTTGYKGLHFKPDGLKYWTVNSSGGNLFLYQFSLSTAWDISGATYDSKSIDLSTQLFDFGTTGASDNDIKGVAFSDAGTKLYLIGNQRDFIYEIDLETVWDINTANFQSYKSPIITPVASPNHCDVTYGNSGNNLYVVISNAPAKIHQYTLSTAFNIRRLTDPSKSKDISAQTTSPKAVRFNSTGTKMFVLGTGASTATVYQYTLSSAWDVSTATYDSVSFSVYTQATDPRGFAFKDDGTKMYVADRTNDIIYQYNIPTGFNLASSVTYDTISLNISSADTNVGGIIFGDSGNKLYITGETNDTIRQYNLSTAWNVSTGTLQSTPVSISLIYANPSGIDISSDGKTIIVSGGDGASLYSNVTAIKLPTAWDISSFAASVKRRSVSPQFTTSGLAIGDSDDKVYYGDNTTNGLTAIQRIDLTTAGYIAGGGTSNAGYSRAYGTTIEDVSISGNGSYLAYVSANKLYVLNLTTAYDITSFKDDFYETGYTSSALQISSDGTKIYNFDGVSASKLLYRYPLPTPYDVDSIATFTNKNTVSLTHLLEDPNTSKVWSDIFLSPDGNSLYILDASSYQIAKLKFGTAYDESTLFSYFQSFPNPKCIRFNSSGTSLFILSSTSTIVQWSLPTAFDIVKYTNVGSLSVAIDNDFKSFTVSIDSSKLYVLGDETNKIYEYRMKTPNDITTGYYFDKLNVSALASNPYTVTFGDSGRKVYVLNNTDDTIYQYTIPIQYDAWDIINAVYDNKSFSVTGLDADPQDIRFMPDGKSFIMLGLNAPRLIQVYVETAWDISTAWNNKSKSISTQDAGGAAALSFGDSGKKMYVVGNNNDRIYQYSMPLSGENTTWDISGSTYDNKSFVLPESAIVGAHLNPSSFVNSNGDTIPAGTRLLMMGDGSNAFYQRTLSTPWDISTAYALKTNTGAKSYDFSNPTTGVLKNLKFGGSGTDQGKKLYILGDTRDCIIQYALSTAYDLDTASYVARYDIVGQNLSAATLNDISFNDTGTRVYIVDDSNNRIIEFRMTTAWDITTATFVPTKTWPNVNNTNATGIAFNSGEGSGQAGKKLYVSDITDSSIYQYELSTSWDINTLTNTSPSAKVLNLSGIDTGIQSVDLSSDGTRLYILGFGNDRVYERKLTTAWDITTAVSPYTSQSFASQVVSASAFTFGGSGADEGKKLYVLCSNNDAIYQYTLSTAWDITTATYDNKSFVYGNETSATGFDISRDGEKLYIIGTTNDRIYQYSLQTPWDISTGLYDNKSLLVSGASGTMNSLKISSDGEWIALTDTTADDVFIYDLTVQSGKLWGNIDTATQNTAVVRDVSSETSPTGVAIAYGSGVTEGTTFYIVGDGTDTIRKYTSATAWTGSWSEVTTSALNIGASVISLLSAADICVSKGGNYIYVLDTNIIYRFTMETAHESKTANIGSVYIGTQDTSATEIRFSSDGTKMFMLGNLNDDIYRYDLAKAWVASSAIFVSGSVISPETNVFGFDISSDGTKYYIVGATEIIREYIPSAAYGTTLSTGTTKDIEWIMSLDAESIKFSNDGLRVFVCDAGKIYQFDLDTAFDISSLNMQYYNAGLEDSSPAAITFKPDGTRMIMAGALNDTIRTYTLNFPWNISSATLTNTSPTLAETAATGIAFNSDGSKFYIIGQGSAPDAIRQYNASNYAITNATVVKQTDLVNYANPFGLAISHTGKQLFTITANYDIIQLELDAAFEIDSIYIDQISESIDATPLNFFVDKDGLRGLFFGSTGDTIRALSFSYKWNINGYTNSSTQSTVPGATVTGIWWSDDGTQVLMADQVTDKIHRYTFGTAWNVTTISSTNSTKTYNLAHDLNPNSLAFNTDGTMMYYIDSLSVIRQIPLKTAYFPDTAYSATLITSGQDGTPKSFCMNSTGSRLFLLGQTNDNIFRYDFGENYSVATLAYATSSVSISTRDSQGTGLECNSDASKFWLVGATNDTIYQLSNSTPNALGTLTLDTSYATTRTDTTPNGLKLSNDGTKLYFTGLDNDTVYQINLTTANTLVGFDERSFNVASQSTTLKSISIDKDGKYLYVYGGEALFQYDISINGSLANASYGNKLLYIGTAVGGPVTPIDFSMSLNGYYFYLLDQNLDNVRVYTTPLF
jgi:sugar lactone lactonase YvrE